MDKKKSLVDIDRVIKNKNPKLYKLLPKFIINYIKRVIHQDDVNSVISMYDKYTSYDFAQKIIEHFEIEIETIGMENIPENGRFIFAANHPVGSMDGIAFMYLMSKKYGVTKSLVNDLLMNVTNFFPLFLGVNKHGMTAKESILAIDEVFKSDLQVIIYPAGLASRRRKGIIRDLEWKKTFISKAKKYKRDIIPVHINGGLTDFFYKFSRLRTILGIKANLEMFYLVDESFKQHGKKLTFSFGKPISYSTFDNRNNPEKWAELVKEHVYKVGEDDINTNFDF